MNYYSVFAKHKPCMCPFCVVNRIQIILFWYLFVIPFVVAFLFTIDLLEPAKDPLQKRTRQAEHVDFLFKEQTGCEREVPHTRPERDEYLDREEEKSTDE